MKISSILPDGRRIARTLLDAAIIGPCWAYSQIVMPQRGCRHQLPIPASKPGVAPFRTVTAWYLLDGKAFGMASGRQGKVFNSRARRIVNGRLVGPVGLV